MERSVALHNKEIHQILAPIKGMVVEVLRRPGEWVEPGEDVLRVIRIDRLRAEGLIPFEFVTPQLVGSDAEITVSIPGRPDIVAKGAVVFVNPELNPVNGRVRVRAEFDNPRGLLMPGMRAKMVIHPRARDANKIDVTATRVPSGGEPYEPAP
jgi:multidrug efflux pump subunit AcrA (membrane-fusion protein)